MERSLVTGLKIITPFYESLRQIARNFDITFEELDSLLQEVNSDQEEQMSYLGIHKLTEMLTHDINLLKEIKANELLQKDDRNSQE